VEEIADLFAELMTDVLGYRRFAAQGGDWGAFVSSVLGWRHPEKLIGIHLNLLACAVIPRFLPGSEEEGFYLRELAHWLKEETGYQWIQGTRPQTLAYALTTRRRGSRRGSPRSSGSGATAAA
jgi:microsomal epoxide hydrolase